MTTSDYPLLYVFFAVFAVFIYENLARPPARSLSSNSKRSSVHIHLNSPFLHPNYTMMSQVSVTKLFSELSPIWRLLMLDQLSRDAKKEKEKLLLHLPQEL